MSTNISTYEQQAIDFLTSTNCSIDITFVKHDLYFPDDKEKRDIYSITLTRGNRSYTFNFGQSVVMREVRNNTDYGKPSAYDVLSCLTKHDPGLLEDFCAEYGYDTDSRKAESTYMAVMDEYLNLAKLFSYEELEKMQEIQ